MADNAEDLPPPVTPAYTRAPTATVSSLNSDHSTQQLICKSPQKTQPKSAKTSVKTISEKASEVVKNGRSSRKLVVFLGLGQMCVGALLLGGGAAAVVKGAALARVGAGLWAGCLAVVTGVVGVLAGINDCYGLNGKGGTGNSGLLVAFLAMSLICLAAGNSAAVLAGTGLHRDYTRAAPPLPNTFQEEMDLWTPVLSNISVLILATAHCLLCITTICHLSKRVCPCFRSKQHFDHNQFDPSGKGPLPGPYVIQVDEKPPRDRQQGHQLCQDLESRLQEEKQKKEDHQFDSATSRSVLVKSWLGRQGGARGVRGGRPMKPPRPLPAPVMLVPAHPATTLGRMPVGMNVMMPPRYATLPHPQHPPPPHIYYPVHDTRIRRRRSPRGVRDERRRRRAHGRERDSQLTRSLERIHRKRRAERERLSEVELKQTYTGLDRAYAEQFIAVCDESRSHAAERSDSLTSTVSSDLSATEQSAGHDF